MSTPSAGEPADGNEVLHGQAAVPGDTTMACSRTCTDADNGGTGFYEIGVVIAECTRLSCASRCEVAWVEKQHDCATFQALR